MQKYKKGGGGNEKCKGDKRNEIDYVILFYFLREKMMNVRVLVLK